uniref:Uncharacterized protein n=1 Tax=Cebus imitator TaxID=2715852 RepID=A0A2K5RBB2_CEBIM
MRIQITIHYLKNSQEASLGVRASASKVKAAVPIRRPSWEGLSDTHWDYFIPVCKYFNSRSSL